MSKVNSLAQVFVLVVSVESLFLGSSIASADSYGTDLPDAGRIPDNHDHDWCWSPGWPGGFRDTDANTAILPSGGERRKTMCHELGHSGGLAHYSGTALDCMVSGSSTLISYRAHAVGHLDALA